MKIYILCPVRNITSKQKKEIEDYVEYLEKEKQHPMGNYEFDGDIVHYPPRDVNQDDETGINICTKHLKAMKECDEVHIFWDRESSGSHFDLGMAFALGKKIVLVKHYQQREKHKSYLNVIYEIQKENSSI